MYATEKVIAEKHQAKEDAGFMQRLMKLIAEHFSDVPALKNGIRTLLDNK